jgi:hypothetical protein
MSLEEFKKMTALSFKGNVIPLGKFAGTNIDIYETFDQNYHRITMRDSPPSDGWKFFYFSNGMLMDKKDIQSIIDQKQAQLRKIEQDKAALLARQQELEIRRQQEKQQAEALAKKDAEQRAAKLQKEEIERAAQIKKEEEAKKLQLQNQQKLNNI